MSSSSVTEPTTTGEPAQTGPTGAQRRYGLGAVALAIVVGMLLGVAAGALIARPGTPGDDSPEAGFARDMSTHHQQAVAMGLIAFQQGSDADVRSIGVDIAASQQGEYGMMQGWLRSWELDPTGEQPRMAWMPDGESMVDGGLMPGMASTEEMERLRTAQGKELDILFLEMMIKHHIGGIHMVDALLDQSDHELVTEAAQRMKNTQQKDLTNLRTALERLQG
ncbi:DUF305 domain-containing protein [Micromonosporaceae bacterium DT55]|uniref:DUF305 domain-containing protein n=1 Tax=Melissospora conviva TaxID=3388432 RepID=UPI003C17AACB